ncbi:MAG: cyclic nucleotide-binding domain-containing protein [Deltaproteobacteria bacterium]|nr:cyclic nucleotide-binding domain-containing protein [Deltaproteobacteria bacterium]
MTTAVNEMIAAIVDESLIFRSLSEDIRDRLKSEAHICEFSPGETIIREGDDGSNMMIVIDGTVQVSQRSKDGEVSLAELGRKAVIGEVSVITGTPRTSTVVALEDVSAICFSKETIQSIVASSPKIKTLLLKLIEGRALQSAGKSV